MPDLASLFVFPAILLFCRLGAMMMTFPGFADISVSMRARMLLAFVLTLALFPILQHKLPDEPVVLSTAVTLIALELFTGVLLAIGARMMMAALNVAGEMIGFTSGFQAAALFDPRSGTNTVAIAILFNVTVITLIFATQLHHVMIRAVVESYTLFPPGTLIPLEDAAFALVKVVGHAFEIGIKIAAPVMAVGFLTYVAFGIFNRLIPQLHVFFVALPITIMLGVFMLGVSFALVLMLFMDELAQNAILFTQTLP